MIGYRPAGERGPVKEGWLFAFYMASVFINDVILWIESVLDW